MSISGRSCMLFFVQVELLCRLGGGHYSELAWTEEVVWPATQRTLSAEWASGGQAREGDRLHPWRVQSLLSGAQANRSLLSILLFERLAVYGFAMDYPTSCKVEFNPKSDRNQGDIAFKSSDGYKIFLSWGEMKKVEKFRDADAHADYSLDRIRGSREAKILEVKRERRRANGHSASFNHVKLDLIKRGIFFNQTKTR